MRPLSKVLLGAGAIALGLQYWRRRAAESRVDPRLAELDPAVRVEFADLLAHAQATGLDARIVSARRSCAQQDAIYAQGRTTPGPIVTGARGCQSWHVWGRAADLSVPGATRARWQELGEWWEARGGTWGGRFPNVDDPGHFEWHPGLTISELCPNPDRCDELVG